MIHTIPLSPLFEIRSCDVSGKVTALSLGSVLHNIRGSGKYYFALRTLILIPRPASIAIKTAFPLIDVALTNYSWTQHLPGISRCASVSLIWNPTFESYWRSHIHYNGYFSLVPRWFGPSNRLAQGFYCQCHVQCLRNDAMVFRCGCNLSPAASLSCACSLAFYKSWSSRDNVLSVYKFCIAKFYLLTIMGCVGFLPFICGWSGLLLISSGTYQHYIAHPWNVIEILVGCQTKIIPDGDLQTPRLCPRCNNGKQFGIPWFVRSERTAIQGQLSARRPKNI